MKELDPLIHSQLRLSICAILASLGEADFMYLKKTTDSTVGNLSTQIKKLEEANYICVEKTFHNKRPRTICRLTDTGKEAFIQYMEDLNVYINPEKKLKADFGKNPDPIPC